MFFNSGTTDDYKYKSFKEIKVRGIVKNLWYNEEHELLFVYFINQEN